MATHDYVIANQSGAAFRTDLNNALAAIVSNNSNSSSPSTTYAYQWWADTTNGVLKIRNSANNAWIELLQLDGTLTLEDGAAATPALAFRDDLNTGLFSAEADAISVATAGAERFRFASAGQIGIGGATYGTSGQVLTSGGASSAPSWTSVSGTTINNNADNRVITGSGTANTLEGESGLTFDGTHLSITDGNLVIATSGHGIDFSATGAGTGTSSESELLTDYEQGTWSPSGSWTSIVARYVKIGRMVYASFQLRANTTSGDVTIGNLPFTATDDGASSGGIAWGVCEVAISNGFINGSVTNNTTTATIKKASGAQLTFGSGSDNMNNSAFLQGVAIYGTDA